MDDPDGLPDWTYTVPTSVTELADLLRTHYKRFLKEEYYKVFLRDNKFRAGVEQVMRKGYKPLQRLPTADELLSALKWVCKAKGPDLFALTKLYASGRMPRIPPMRFNAVAGDGPFIRIDDRRQLKRPEAHEVIKAVMDQQSDTPLIRYAIETSWRHNGKKFSKSNYQMQIQLSTGVYNGAVSLLEPDKRLVATWDSSELIDYPDVFMDQRKSPVQLEATAYIRVCLQTLTALRPIILALAPDRRAALGLAIRDDLAADMAEHYLTVVNFDGESADVEFPEFLAAEPFGVVPIVPTLKTAVWWLEDYSLDGIMLEADADPDGAAALQFASATQEEDGPVVVRGVSWWDVAGLWEMSQRGAVMIMPHIPDEVPATAAQPEPKRAEHSSSAPFVDMCAV